MTPTFEEMRDEASKEAEINFYGAIRPRWYVKDFRAGADWAREHLGKALALNLYEMGLLVGHAQEQLAAEKLKVEKLREGLKKIRDHKPASVDKVDLLLQCDGYRDCAANTLAEVGE